MVYSMPMETRNVDAALARAIEKVGGPVALSRLFGGKLTRQAIEQWKRCPPARAIEVEKLTGISRHELRPDIYPVES